MSERMNFLFQTCVLAALASVFYFVASYGCTACLSLAVFSFLLPKLPLQSLQTLQSCLLQAEGVAALKEVIAAVPQDIPVLLDAKRGDIGTTAAAYASAAFEVTDPQNFYCRRNSCLSNVPGDTYVVR